MLQTSRNLEAITSVLIEKMFFGYWQCLVSVKLSCMQNVQLYNVHCRFCFSMVNYGTFSYWIYCFNSFTVVIKFAYISLWI